MIVILINRSTAFEVSIYFFSFVHYLSTYNRIVHLCGHNLVMRYAHQVIVEYHYVAQITFFYHALLNIPLDREVIQTVMIVALIVGILAFLFHRRGHYPHVRYTQPQIANIRHDMSDLYRDKRLSKRLTRGLRKVRHEAKELNEHPEETNDVLLQLKRMLPAEGWLTQKMAQLRAKAHRIRNGHIARLEETRQVFSKLPTSVKKKAAAELADRYRQIIGIDTRLERLDKSVAEYERRIRNLTAQAQRYAANYDYQKLHGCLRAVEKLQNHNTRLLKIIVRTENKLSAIAKEIARQAREVNKK